MNNPNSRQFVQQIAPNKRTICVDLDGTLLQYDGWKGEEHFDQPLPGSQQFLKKLREKYKVVIYTTRTNCSINRTMGCKEIVDLIDFTLKSYGFEYDEIYKDEDKPLCEYFIDDRAISIPTNPKPNDYVQILNKLLK